MDQCTHCTVKGDLAACMSTPCGYHDLWIVGELREIIGCIVLNSVIGPDAAIGGTTDCYHVPLDDVDNAKKIL